MTSSSSSTSTYSGDTLMFETSTASSVTTEHSRYSDIGDDATSYNELVQAPNRKRRKSVAFSSVTQTVIIGHNDDDHIATTEPCHKMPLSNSSNRSSETMPRPFSHHSENFSTPSSSVSKHCVAPSMMSLDYSQIPLETVSLTSRKRRLSIATSSPPDMRPVPAMGAKFDFGSSQEVMSPSSKQVFPAASAAQHATHPKHEPPHPKTKGALQSNAQASPGDKPDAAGIPLTSAFSREATRRIRDTFDLSQHIRHRKYIVHTLKFSPTPTSGECVIMLDEGVARLLPAAYPPLPPSPSDTVTAAPAKGVGIGIFARRAIRNLEVVLRERPVLVTPYVIDVAVPLAQLYADIVRKLAPDVLVRLQELAPSTGEHVGPVALDCEAIMRTHALAVDLAVPEEAFAELATHRALFLQTSRCNHSCGPNAKWEWDAASFSLVLAAVRPIAPGEEITIAYVPPHHPHAERAAALRALYAFECRCAHCTLPAAQRAASDAARTELAAFWGARRPTFKEWCADPALPRDVLLQAHMRAVDMIAREGLHVLDSKGAPGSERAEHFQRDLGRHLDAIATCYGALHDVENFRIWVQKALDAREGGRAEEMLAFKKWLSNPVSFPVWGKRANLAESTPKAKMVGSHGSAGNETFDSR